MNMPYDPEELLAESVTLHAGGDILAAAEARVEALDYLAEDDPRRPGVLAAYAFSRRFTDDSLPALLGVAQDAYQAGKAMMTDVSRNDQDRGIIQGEFPSIALHVGVLAARQAIEISRNGDAVAANATMSDARRRVQEATRGTSALIASQHHGLKRVHQWQINAARREAAITALDPQASTPRALRLAAKAIALSPLSESGRFVHGVDPNSTLKNRMYGKTKAFVGGVASAAVCGLTMVPKQKGLSAAQALAMSKFVL